MYAVDTSHPYGITPEGNRFFHSKSIRSPGLGNMAPFNDQILLEILSYCTGCDLARLSQVSLTLYVFSHHVDLWRDLTLKLCHNQPCYFLSSWKDTYASLYSHQHLSPHKPIKVSNFSSDLFYRSWVTRKFDLELSCPGFFTYSNVDQRHVNELTCEEFIEKYEKLNKPVVIQGLVTQWQAYHKWNYEYFKKFYSNQIFRATSGTSSEPASFTIHQYEAYAHSSSYEEVPLYLFDRNFAIKISQNTFLESSDMSRTCPPTTTTSSSLGDDYLVPQYFNSSTIFPSQHKTDLFSLLSDDIRPDYRWLIIGPNRSGSIFHIDPNQTHAWNACIRGRKKWIFYPPTIPPPGIYVTADGADVTVPLSTGEWLLSFWKYHLQNRIPTPTPPTTSSSASISNSHNLGPLEIIVEPGELIFVPHGWWHMVINLDEESMAITQNYVSSTNLMDCYEFLRDKSDQISGLRYQYNCDEYRSQFHQIFGQKLQETYPSLYDQMIEGLVARESEQKNSHKNLSNTSHKKRKSKLAAIFHDHQTTSNIHRGNRQSTQNENEENGRQQAQRRKRSNSFYQIDDDDDNNKSNNGGDSDESKTSPSLSLSPSSDSSPSHPPSSSNISHSHSTPTPSTSTVSVASSSFSFSFNF